MDEKILNNRNYVNGQIAQPNMDYHVQMGTAKVTIKKEHAVIGVFIGIIMLLVAAYFIWSNYQYIMNSNSQMINPVFKLGNTIFYLFIAVFFILLIFFTILNIIAIFKIPK